MIKLTRLNFSIKIQNISNYKHQNFVFFSKDNNIYNYIEDYITYFALSHNNDQRFFGMLYC